MKALTTQQQIETLKAIDYKHMVEIRAGLCYAIAQAYRKLYSGSVLSIDVALLIPLFTNKNALPFGAYETENPIRFWWKSTPESLPQRQQFINWIIQELNHEITNS